MKRCAIICTGTSVDKGDLARIDVPKVGINWSYLGTQSDIHVVTNFVFIRKHGKELPFLTPKAEHRFSGLPARGAHVPKRIMNYANWDDYSSGKRIPPLPGDYDIYRDGWVFAGGGPCALQVAISFGFDEIVFIGLDLETGDGCHFYEDDGTRRDFSEFSGYARPVLDKAWIIQAEYFRQVKPELSARGIRVLNTGLSDIFERVPFEEIWP